MTKQSTIGATIAKRRRKLGLTQEELARAAGVHGSTLAKIEAGVTTRPGAHTVARLASALRMDVRLALASIMPNGTISATLNSDSSVAWAQVSVNGTDAGRVYRGTRLAISKPAGTWTVRMSQGDLSAEQVVTVRSAATVNVGLTLGLAMTLGRVLGKELAAK